jgi:hypothetical protein
MQDRKVRGHRIPARFFYPASAAGPSAAQLSPRPDRSPSLNDFLAEPDVRRDPDFAALPDGQPTRFPG